ncbi:MAG: hypothetical protein V7L25_18595 [Nostoc sp.]|uniref:hypothetical protein n=1 Tax=Nostoc sp. TaxID=1180 RepID=UPI002FEEFFAA
MNDKVITDVSQIALDCLNSVLIDSKALVTGSVEDFASAALGSANARSAKILLQYNLGTTGTLAILLFLKMCAGKDSIFGAFKVNYYTQNYIYFIKLINCR